MLPYLLLVSLIYVVSCQCDICDEASCLSNGVINSTSAGACGEDKKDSSKQVYANPGIKSDTSQCRFYLAESSIPNSGLGMYTSVPLKQGDYIHSEIVLQITDFHRHKNLRQISIPNDQGLVDDHTSCREWADAGECDINPAYMNVHCVKSCFDVDHGIAVKPQSHWMPDDYYWHPSNGHGTYFADSVESIIPGIGMLANSHTGLFNVQLNRPDVDNAGLDRRKDPGAGAFSTHHNFRFTALKDIPAGMELFAQYGDPWFEGREKKLGTIPLSYDYEAGDEVVAKFLETVDKLGMEVNQVMIQDTWNFVRDEFLKDNERLHTSLPQNVNDLLQARRGNGTIAMYSVPHVVRTLDWLNDNGICIDGLYSAKSTVSQAGRGAFASRSFRTGQVIAPAPVIHIERQALRMYHQKGESDKVRYTGEQLILNYCYGHPQSSLLLFPYSPTVNFINHSRDPNAVVRWSTLANHHADWLQTSVSDVLEQGHAGLILEFVAIRNITEGEEIFIDYGMEWERAWLRHVSSWIPPPVSDDFIPVETINTDVLIRTKEEQLLEPYPGHIMLICFFYQPSDDFKEDGQETSFTWDLMGRTLDDLTRTLANARPCEVLERYNEAEQYEYSYRVRIELSDELHSEVTGMPRVAMQFIDRPYEGDQFLSTAFRHEIHVPDHLYPSNWRNLESAQNQRETTDLYDEFSIVTDSPSDVCRYYMAQSSIPNAGIGLYAGINLNVGDYTQPDIAIHSHDYNDQLRLRCEYDTSKCNDQRWLISSYDWAAHMTWAQMDADSISAMSPGLGAMGNFHPALYSAHMIRPKKNGGRLSRGKDPGAGAISAYHGVRYEVNKEIPVGMEIFISYGEKWLIDRESSIGMVPLMASYQRADTILQKFSSFMDTKNLTDDPFISDVWTFIREELTFDERVTKALPNRIDGVIHAAEVGSAFSSVPDVVKSLEWLESNAVCVDRIRSGVSTNSAAGLGAFAIGNFLVGDVITTTPVIQISRRDTTILKKSSDGHIFKSGDQLILNYCYGHSNSTLLFFPYAPVVNYINHNAGDNVNARLEWSSFPLHKAEWLELSVHDILSKHHSGLFFDIIATKTIKAGEEIFLDYGADWETKWAQHVHDWNPPHADYVSAVELQSSQVTLRTVFEQSQKPYPSNVMMVCFVPDDIEQRASRDGPTGHEYEWYESVNLRYFGDSGIPCDIISRQVSTESGNFQSSYSADVKFSHGTVRVGGIPRQFIYFLDKPYTTDEYISTAFRHEIGIPNEIFPVSWMDLDTE